MQEKFPPLIQGEGFIGSIPGVLGNRSVSRPDAPLIRLQGENPNRTVLHQSEPYRAIGRRGQAAAVAEHLRGSGLPGHVRRQGQGALPHGFIIVPQKFLRRVHRITPPGGLHLGGVDQKARDFLPPPVLDALRQQKNKVPGHVGPDARADIQGVLGLRRQRLKGLVLQTLQIPGVGVLEGLPVRLPHRRQGGIEEAVRQGLQLLPADGAGGKGVVPLPPRQHVHQDKAVPQVRQDQRAVPLSQPQSEGGSVRRLKAPLLEVAEVPDVQRHVVKGPLDGTAELVLDGPVALQLPGPQLRAAVQAEGAVFVDVAGVRGNIFLKKVPHGRGPDLRHNDFHPLVELQIIFGDDLLQLAGHLLCVNQIVPIALLKARGLVADSGNDGPILVVAVQKRPPLRQGPALRRVSPAGEADEILVHVLSWDHHSPLVRYVHAALLRQQRVPEAEEVGRHRQRRQSRQQGDGRRQRHKPFQTSTTFAHLIILPSNFSGPPDLGEGFLVKFPVTHPASPPPIVPSAVSGPGPAGW